MMVSEKNTLLASRRMNSVTRSLDYVWLATLMGVALSLAGCAAQVTQSHMLLHNGKYVDYVHGRTDSQGGVELAFVDRFVDGQLIASHAHGGETLVAKLVGSVKEAGLMAAGFWGLGVVGSLADGPNSKSVSSPVVNNYQVSRHHRCETCGWRR